MKRLIFIAPLVFALSACSGSTGAGTPPDMDISFSAEADISYDGLDCTAQVRRIERDIWEFCVTAPYPVEGLVITVKNGETKLKMFDTESAADVSADTVSMARAVVTAYESAAKNGTPVTEGYSASAVSGNSELGSCTVVFDENGVPVSMTFDAGRLNVGITKFAPLERAGEEDEDAVVIVE